MRPVVPVVSVAVLVAVTVLATGCVASSVAPLPPPPTVEILPTTTSVPDFSAVSLPPVAGTTTTVPVQISGGAATIKGLVTSGGAPIEGAAVRIERFVDDRTVGTTVTTGANGGYTLSNVKGGRYRVRAFRAPDLAQTQAVVFFLGASEARNTDLGLDKFGGGTNVLAAIAPDPPLLGEKANLVVSISTKGVDGAGVARSIPAVGVPLVLSTAGGRIITTANPVATNASGQATWTIACASLEKQEMAVMLPDATSYPISVSACKVPPPTTTTTAVSPDATPTQ
jgi:hypothetical protein